MMEVSNISEEIWIWLQNRDSGGSDRHRLPPSFRTAGAVDGASLEFGPREDRLEDNCVLGWDERIRGCPCLFLQASSRSSNLLFPSTLPIPLSKPSKAAVTTALYCKRMLRPSPRILEDV